MNTASRRRFLQGVAAVSSLGLAARLDLLSCIATAAAQSQGSDDYKALVCVFLFGGNDGNNTLIPLNASGYGAYAAVRTTASGIQLAPSELLPIAPANTPTVYGLHPALPELQTLFAQGRMAVLANVAR